MRPRPLALVLVAALLAVLGAPPGSAQETGAATPEVPSGPAALRGRVLRAATGEPAAGVAVMLYALDRGGAPGLRRSRTDAEGRFAFEGLSNDGGLTYLVGARYQGVPYGGGRVRFGEGERERSVEIRVAEVTRDADALALEEARLRVQGESEGVRVVETLRVANRSDRTFYVPPEARPDARPAARVRLPEAASDFQVPFGVVPEGVVREGSALAWWGPVYPRPGSPGAPGGEEAPGAQELTFSYALEASQGRVEIDAAFPESVERVTLLVPEGGPRPQGASLTETGTETVQGRSHRRYTLAPSDSGRVEVALALPEARVVPEGVSLAEARLVIDLDDAAMEVRETHVLDVEGEENVRAPPGKALLRIPLPEGARNVRLGAEASGVRLAPHPGGGLAVDGVAPPGESAVEIAYRLPVEGEPARLARRFAERVPLLSIYIADTGRLVPESERLHRRRPVRTQDRTYMHLEAFEVEPEETVELAVGRLPAREELPRAAVPLLVLAAGAAIAWLLVAPLRRERAAAGAGAATGPADAATAPVARERSAVYAALRDLEEDHETGKISAEDYARLRDELRGRALALLREERARAAAAEEEGGALEASARSEAAPSGEEACPACGAVPRAGDRFCAQCGRPLAAAAGREARG